MSAAPRSAPLGTPVVATFVAVGAAATAVGGLGVGFRAAGFGYLGQSLLTLAVGVALLFGGLRTAARDRRDSFAELRLATVRPDHTVHADHRGRAHRTGRTVPARPAPRMYSRPTPAWHQPSPFAAPARQRVHAWIDTPLELPPASAA